MAGRGRPKKVVQVLSDTPEQIVVAQAPQESSVDHVSDNLEFKDVAFSITRDPVTQKWIAVSVSYDIKTKTVGTLTVVEANTDRSIIMERFQALAGNEFMSS